jgi:hypothetical protein
LFVWSRAACSLTPTTSLQLALLPSTRRLWDRASLLNGAVGDHAAELPSLKELGEAIQRHQITTLWLTAGLFQLMVDEELSH